ncbi:unnamed protein product [Rotaria magnacalcarata]|uniref:Uncharacterized protein n=1 Tax=Rotaria magnacalcarata TaxID=392030 RepID=A0A8S3J7F7_9BILA|nr:unnamed protein product [Rotaria magnacalcarata]CAF5212741.1 unnamed protein product [Rotaria magnacalcarata]
MILNNHSFLMYISLFFVSAVNALSFRTSNYRLSWTNCGPISDPAQLKSLTINPDPIRIPGKIIHTTAAVVDGSSSRRNVQECL